MAEQTFKLERVDAETGRIFSGNQIVGTLNWTDSFWALDKGYGMPLCFTDLRDPDEMSAAYLRAVGEGAFAAQGTDLDFFLDPPTFVGPTDGERACWIYTAWKLLVDGKPVDPVDFREWDASEFRAANAIYRRVVRKYGDSPPDKAEEVQELVKE